MPRISIIMRSKNDGWIIDRTLKNLYSQSIKDFELINIDSGSTDNTRSIINNYPGRLFTIKPEEYIPGVVLNAMIHKSRGDIIVLLNSDCPPLHDTWLENLLKPLSDPEVGIVFSRQVPRKNAYKLVAYDYLRAYPPTEKTNMHEDFVSFASCAFPRKLWEKHPIWEGGLSEDFAWYVKSLKNKYKKVYAHKSEVEHSHNLTPKALFRKEFYQGGEAMVYIYKVRPSLFNQGWLCAKAIIRDLIYCLPKGYIKAFCYSFYFRTSQHLAFYLGKKSGERKFLNTL